MAQYRKKPAVIEAVPVAEALLAAGGDWALLPKWLMEAYEAGKILFLPDAIEMATLEGHMRAEKADMIIRGVAGEIYPCKPGIFEATYEAVA